MALLDSVLRDAAVARASASGLLTATGTLLPDYNVMSSETVESLVYQGLLEPTMGGGMGAGLVLNVATSSATSASDIAHLIPPGIRHELATALLMAMDVRSSPEIQLLNTTRQSAHYFDFDRLIVAQSLGRGILATLVRQLVQLTIANTLASAISPSGLIGPYPLCCHLGIENGYQVAAVLIWSRENPRLIAPGAIDGSTAVILSDAITTGTSGIRLAEVLRARDVNVLGVVNVYNREEGDSAGALAAADLSMVSLFGRTTLRADVREISDSSDCDAEVAEKARVFLAATSGVRLQTVDFHRAPPKSFLAMVALAGPTANDFDAALRLRSDARTVQTLRLARLVGEAKDQHASLLVLPELTVPAESEGSLLKATADGRLVVIAGAEYDASRRNAAFVAIQGQVYRQSKLVASPYDAADLLLGDTLQVFKNTAIGDFCVLVCADQFDAHVAAQLAGHIDLMIVAARNGARETSAGAATGDVYRLWCHVLYVNDASAGGSFVASPIPGPQKVKWFDPTGSEQVHLEIDIAGLRARQLPYMSRVSLDGSDHLKWQT